VRACVRACVRVSMRARADAASYGMPAACQPSGSIVRVKQVRAGKTNESFVVSITSLLCTPGVAQRCAAYTLWSAQNTSLHPSHSNGRKSSALHPLQPQCFPGADPTPMPPPGDNGAGGNPADIVFAHAVRGTVSGTTAEAVQAHWERPGTCEVGDCDVHAEHGRGVQRYKVSS
jgi:hypothetical protein